jgi:hypothetical protein
MARDTSRWLQDAFPEFDRKGREDGARDAALPPEMRHGMDPEVSWSAVYRIAYEEASGE